MDIVTVGIDLAKNVFALHGVDQSGKAVFIKPRVARSQLLEMIAHLPPCLIGMEACSGEHYWAREFSRYGHTVKLADCGQPSPSQHVDIVWSDEMRPGGRFSRDSAVSRPGRRQRRSSA